MARVQLCSCDNCVIKIETYCISNNLCHYCKRALVPVGNARANGKAHNDWRTRRYHKKCWRKSMVENEKDIITFIGDTDMCKLQELIGTCRRRTI